MNTDPTLHVAVQGDREIIITRTLNAPRELVFKAMNEPELLRRWLLGPPGWTMTVCENDPRPGGVFRCAWRREDGSEMAMHGVYREVTPPSRIVRTEQFDVGCAPQAGEQVATAELTGLPGDRTGLKITLLFPSREARDGMLASGMERGMAASYDRLAGILAENAARGR